MVGWHHHLKGHQFEQALGDGEAQGSLAGCSLWGCKESDRSEQLNNEQKTGNDYCGKYISYTFLFLKYKQNVNWKYEDESNKQIIQI